MRPSRSRVTDAAIECDNVQIIANPPSSLCNAINRKEVQGMNWDRIEGNWKQFKGSVKEQWGKLTDDQLDIVEGKRDRLAGKIQEAYGVTAEAAEHQLSTWQKEQKDRSAH